MKGIFTLSSIPIEVSFTSLCWVEVLPFELNDKSRLRKLCHFNIESTILATSIRTLQLQHHRQNLIVLIHFSEYTLFLNQPNLTDPVE